EPDVPDGDDLVHVRAALVDRHSVREGVERGDAEAGDLHGADEVPARLVQPGHGEDQVGEGLLGARDHDRPVGLERDRGGGVGGGRGGAWGACSPAGRFGGGGGGGRGGTPAPPPPLCPPTTVRLGGSTAPAGALSVCPPPPISTVTTPVPAFPKLVSIVPS